MPAAHGDRVGQHAGAHHPALPAHQVATAHAPAVLYIYTSLHPARRSRMNFFIMHLALADLSVGLLSVSTDIVW